jgi:hypothetical protein
LKRPPPFPAQLESTVNQAFAYAKKRNHEEVTLEHLLLLLLDDADASAMLKACGVDLGALRKNSPGRPLLMLTGCITSPMSWRTSRPKATAHPWKRFPGR